jgi:hypothetical protein
MPRCVACDCSTNRDVRIVREQKNKQLAPDMPYVKLDDGNFGCFLCVDCNDRVGKGYTIKGIRAEKRLKQAAKLSF